MTNATGEVRILLIGAGNLGRRFARMIAEKHDELHGRYGLDLRIVGVADSRGAVIDAAGLDGRAIAAIKETGGSVGDLHDVGRPGMSGLAMLETCDADILCEAGPVNLDAGGEPGLTHVRAALELGMHVTTPNKGPIVLAYRELTELAKRHGASLRFDGTVAGGLPALYVGMRDLRGATIARIDAIPNLTTGFVIDRIVAGASWDEAIEAATVAGALEGDGAWDLDGWDAAAKLSILAQAVLGVDAPIDEIPRVRVRELDPEWLRAECAGGRRVRLLASAFRNDEGGYDLLVSPTTMPKDHPLAVLGSTSMGIVYETDIYGTITAIIDEPTPLPSAATMLRDLLDIYA